MSTSERLEQVPSLDAGHAVTPVLAERLLVASRGGLGACAHLPAGATTATWWAGASTRSCLDCARVRLRFVAFDIAGGDPVRCDGCALVDLTEAHGQACLLPVGPVLVIAMLCDLCRHLRLRAEYDLEGAGRQVASSLIDGSAS